MLLSAFPVAGSAGGTPGQLARIDHVADGDTIDLVNGQRVRLVQIDTPEVFFSPECWGNEASAATKRLLPPGTLVRLRVEPATDRVDQYGRLLRYVIRARDGLNVNIELVRHGNAAPYFYGGRRGRYAAQLTRLALNARARRRERAHRRFRCGKVATDRVHQASDLPRRQQRRCGSAAIQARTAEAPRVHRNR
jgi:endonuclease YncB( thermonuclease family)